MKLFDCDVRALGQKRLDAIKNEDVQPQVNDYVALQEGQEQRMKHVVTTALIVILGAAGVSAEERPVKMKFSGSFVPTSIVMQPDTITDEELLAGNGALGSFTFRKLRTDALAPQPSAACSGPSQENIPVVAGGGVFRFEDGSLLTVVISEEGALCIDFDARVAHLSEKYQITGGTGRFKSASGTLELRATVSAALFTSSGQAVLLTSTGELEGTVRTRNGQ